jgi:hypothetical protein
MRAEPKNPQGVQRYGRSWAVFDTHRTLVCFTVYKKGAVEVARRLGLLEGRAVPAIEPLDASPAAIKVLCSLAGPAQPSLRSRANRVWPLRAFVESHVLRELCHRLRTVLRSEVPGLMLLRGRRKLHPTLL